MRWVKGGGADISARPPKKLVYKRHVLDSENLGASISSPCLILAGELLSLTLVRACNACLRSWAWLCSSARCQVSVTVDKLAPENRVAPWRLLSLQCTEHMCMLCIFNMIIYVCSVCVYAVCTRIFTCIHSWFCVCCAETLRSLEMYVTTVLGE